MFQQTKHIKRTFCSVMCCNLLHKIKKTLHNSESFPYLLLINLQLYHSCCYSNFNIISTRFSDKIILDAIKSMLCIFGMGWLLSVFYDVLFFVCSASSKDCTESRVGSGGSRKSNSAGKSGRTGDVEK